MAPGICRRSREGVPRDRMLVPIQPEPGPARGGLALGYALLHAWDVMGGLEPFDATKVWFDNGSDAKTEKSCLLSCRRAVNRQQPFGQNSARNVQIFKPGSHRRYGHHMRARLGDKYPGPSAKTEKSCLLSCRRCTTPDLPRLTDTRSPCRRPALTIDTDIQFTATSAGANQAMRHAELVGEGALRLPEHRAREHEYRLRA